MEHNKHQIIEKELNAIRLKTIAACKEVLRELGGKVNVAYYHENEDLDRNIFFELDDKGYGRGLFLGRELFLKLVSLDEEDAGEEDDGITIILSDTEDDYVPVWSSTMLTSSDALWLLWELEAIADIVEESGKDVVTMYDPED